MTDIAESSSISTRKGKKGIKNAQLAEFPTEQDALNKWSIPKVPSKNIYKIGFFDYKSLIAIKTLERTVTVDQDDQTMRLLHFKDIESYLDKYQYIHIGLVQVAFKPLTLQGHNASILTCLRDGRCLNWSQSLMGIMETSLCNGPVFFNVYPNLSLSLTDPNLLEAISLNIKTHGYEFLPESETIAVIYRIHYKALTTLAPNAKYHTKPGKTVLIDTNLLSSNIATNRQIKWNEVNFPESWILPQAINPKPIINKDIEQIIETNDGEVEVIFNPQRRIKMTTSIGDSSRRSLSSTSRHSFKTPLVEGVRMSQAEIPHIIYAKDKESDKSPTESEMQFTLP